MKITVPLSKISKKAASLRRKVLKARSFKSFDVWAQAIGEPDLSCFSDCCGCCGGCNCTCPAPYDYPEIGEGTTSHSSGFSILSVEDLIDGDVEALNFAHVCVISQVFLLCTEKNCEYTIDIHNVVLTDFGTCGTLPHEQKLQVYDFSGCSFPLTPINGTTDDICATGSFIGQDQTLVIPASDVDCRMLAIKVLWQWTCDNDVTNPIADYDITITIGPESLRHNKRTFLQAIKRQAAMGTLDQLRYVPGCKEPKNCDACQMLPNCLEVTITAIRSGMPACMEGFTFKLRREHTFDTYEWNTYGSRSPEDPGCHCGFAVHVDCQLQLDGSIILETQFDAGTAFFNGRTLVTDFDPFTVEPGTIFEPPQFVSSCDFEGDWDFDYQITGYHCCSNCSCGTDEILDLGTNPITLSGAGSESQGAYQMGGEFVFCPINPNCSYTITLTNFAFFGFGTCGDTGDSHCAVSLDIANIDSTCESISYVDPIDSALVICTGGIGDAEGISVTIPAGHGCPSMRFISPVVTWSCADSFPFPGITFDMTVTENC